MDIVKILKAVNESEICFYTEYGYIYCKNNKDEQVIIGEYESNRFPDREYAKKIMTIYNHYGIHNQIKQFHSEVFELIEAMITYEDLGDGESHEAEIMVEHVKEEISDCLVMIAQFMDYYMTPERGIKEIMKQKIDRQIERINNEKSI